jgi:hypothetical protein
MIELQGQEGELTMTIQITRKETGEVEEYNLVGHCTDEEFKQLIEGVENGSNTLNSGT